MKRFLIGVITIVIIYAITITVSAEEAGSIQINNVTLNSDAYYAKTENGIYVPVRAVCEAMDCTVTWIDETQTVEITRGGKKACVQIGAEIYSFEGVNFRCKQATFIEGKTYIPLSIVLDCFDAKHRYSDEDGSLLIVAYPTYKDASVLVELGVITKENFEQEGYITNAEALDVISYAIGRDREDADLAEWPRHTHLRSYADEFKKLVLSLVYGPINYDEIPDIKYEENMTEYEAVLYCTRLIYDTYGCTDIGDRHHTEKEDVYYIATAKGVIDTADTANAEKPIERRAFYEMLYRTMCYEYSRGGYALTTDRYICDHFEKTIDALND